MIPLPGTTSIAHLHSNIASAHIALTDNQMSHLSAITHQD